MTEREQWPDGPPYELFKRMRSECPVHWTEKISEYPNEAGYWSVTTADDVHAVSRDWQTYSSATGITALRDAIIPLELTQAMFIGMDPPKHDRLKALFQRGFTPEADRRARGHDPRDHGRRARPAGGPRGVRPRDRRGAAGGLARDRQLHGHHARGRRGLGAADEHHARRGRPRPQPGRRRVRDAARRAGDLRALRQADRRAPRAPDRRPHERARARRGGRRDGSRSTRSSWASSCSMAAGNDSTKATYCSGMRALLENPEQRQKLLDDPALVPAAVEESLRMFPAFAHFARTATRDTELNGAADRRGRQGGHVVRVVEPRRDALRGPGQLRGHAQPRAPGLRRRRAALLPRHRARAARAADPARGDAQALPAHGAGRAAASTPSRPSSTS